MILDIPPTNGRVPAAVRDSARHAGGVGKTSGGDFADVMVQTAREPTLPPAPAAREVPYWQDQEFGFGDVLDIVNPLHHIPIVATFYRNLTSDKIGFVPRVVGGALWGRIGGLVGGVINSVVEWFTGKDVGDHIYAAVWGERQPTSTTQTARAKDAPVDGYQEIAPARQVVEVEPTEVTPMLADVDIANLPAKPTDLTLTAPTIRPLPGINHWHDPTEIDAPFAGVRIRLRA